MLYDDFYKFYNVCFVYDLLFIDKFWIGKEFEVCFLSLFLGVRYWEIDIWKFLFI